MYNILVYLINYAFFASTAQINMMLMFRKHSYTIVQLCISVVFLYNFAYVQASIQCARTQDEWNKASASLQCQEPNYYHCLRNENGILTQQCLQRVWIQNGMSLLIHIIQLILDNDNKKRGNENLMIVSFNIN